MAYVMVIDDDLDFATTTATVVEASGHEVEIETDVVSAERSMLGRRPELVILDVMFPEDCSAGFTLARKMRHQLKQLAEVPILFLTAVNERSPLGFGSRDIDPEWLPVTEFLEKPIELDVLAGRVSGLLGGAGAE